MESTAGPAAAGEPGKGLLPKKRARLTWLRARLPFRGREEREAPARGLGEGKLCARETRAFTGHLEREAPSPAVSHLPSECEHLAPSGLPAWGGR